MRRSWFVASLVFDYLGNQEFVLFVIKTQSIVGHFLLKEGLAAKHLG